LVYAVNRAVYAVLQNALQKLRAELSRHDCGHRRRSIMTATIPAVNDPAQIAILGASSAEYLLQLALDQYAAKEFDAEQALELMAQQLATIEQQLAPIAALREQVRASTAGLMVDAGLTKAVTAQAQLTRSGSAAFAQHPLCFVK